MTALEKGSLEYGRTPSMETLKKVRWSMANWLHCEDLLYGSLEYGLIVTTFNTAHWR